MMRQALGWSLCLFLVGPLGLVVGCAKDREGAASAGTNAAEKGTQAPSAVTAESALDHPAIRDARRLSMMRTKDGLPVDQTIEQMQGRIDRYPTKIDSWLELGQAWIRKARESAEPGFYKNAEACAEVVLHLAPDLPMALDLKGLVLLNDHRFAEARDLSRRVLSKNQRDAVAFGTLSDAYLELGDYELAAEAAQRMLSIKPNLPSYSRAAHLAWLKGDDKNAKELMRLAIDSSTASRKDPEPRAWALTQAAMIFWHEGDYEGADAGFEMAEQTFSGYPPALVGRARVALAQGRPKDAVTFLTKSYERSPLVETAWLLGDAKTAAGDEKGAEAAYTDAIRHGRRADPRTLSLMLATLGRQTGEALALAEEERKVRGDLYTKDAHAWALYRAGRVKEARAAIDEAMALGTKDARLLYHAGAIRMASGDPKDVEAGKALLRQALQRNPKFDLRGAQDISRLLGVG